MKEDLAIEIKGLKKKYKLGTIGGGTLKGDIQSWWARKRGKEDPNAIIGSEEVQIGEEFYALNGIDLEVKKGEAIGIIGMNGAGKSTLLKILSRVTAPSEGEVHIKGRITSMLEVGTGFHGELTGRENIYMNGAILGMTRKEVDEKIEEIIDFSECRQFIDTPVKRYSSGMYVKLAFSVAAHLDSEIMIMDEVLAVGDVNFQDKCLEKMCNASMTEGKTILYVSHNMNTIRKLCKRCVVLNHGKIIFDGDVEKAIECYLSYNRDFVKYVDFRENSEGVELFGKAQLLEMELLGKDNPIYEQLEPMKIRVKWKSQKDNMKVYFRTFPIMSDGTVVGMTVTTNPITTKKDVEYDTVLECDFSCLIPGKYYLSVTMFEVDELGNTQYVALVKRGVAFEVIKKIGIDLNIDMKRYEWGVVRLPNTLVRNS